MSLNRDLSLNKMSLNRDCTELLCVWAEQAIMGSAKTALKGLVQLDSSLYSGWGFLGSQWDRQLKFLKNQCIVLAIFQHFSFGPPLETMKKSCLNKLKFWEASWNLKRNLSRKFQYSILKNAETSHIPASISENPVPLYEVIRFSQKGCFEIYWPLLKSSHF